MIKMYRGTPFKPLKQAVDSVLCDIKWCKVLRERQAQQEQMQNSPPSDPAGTRGRYDHPPFPERPLPPARSLQSQESEEISHQTRSDPPADEMYDPSTTSDNPFPPARASTTKESNVIPHPEVEEQQSIRGKKGYYRCKELHKKLYKQIRKIWLRLTSDEKIKECMILKKMKRSMYRWRSTPEKGEPIAPPCR